MNLVRIALANLPHPGTRDESVALAVRAVADASAAGAMLVAFPECFVPGYRVPGAPREPPDPRFLEASWAALAAACEKSGVVAVVGTERFVDGALHLTALVIAADGTLEGFQDKTQLDPSEEQGYSPGAGRRLFHAGPLTFGVAICHEGFRYPETVRWAARRGAHLVLHPHYSWHEPGGYVPSQFADPANTFHEKAILCRAAENSCYVATINCAEAQSPTTSAVVRPDGTVLAYQPYGQEGLLVADIDLEAATRQLASRFRPEAYGEA